MITTAHVINLDKDAAKLTTFRKQSLPVPVERWTATYGKDLHAKALPAQGIGGVIVQSGKGAYAEQWKNLRNLGTVGCFLSHRSLLHYCATLQVPDTAGHLILEDDALFAEGFQERWEAVRHHVPTDWDIVYLGIHEPKGRSLGNGVSKLYTVKDTSGNWGLHGYLVRHGAIRTKLLPVLSWMFEAIDGQLNMFFDEWNCYALDHSLITVNKTVISTIQTM